MDPILLDIPTEIKTKRLWLHVPKPGEGKKVNEAIQESLEELKPWLHFARNKQTVEDTERYNRKAYADFLLRKDLRFHIYELKSNRFLGTIGLHHIDWEIPKFEIAYWMRTKAAGNGYMSEAA
ncbi:MAG TPA: GNAT family N-acetyltransferase, partial [Bacillales bacterium]|nr:GNAT family N-acetyltransferase [Bacillales bacterium]